MNKIECIQKSADILTRLYKKPIEFSLYFDRKTKWGGIANYNKKYIVLNNKYIDSDLDLYSILLHEYGHLKLKHLKSRIKKRISG